MSDVKKTAPKTNHGVVLGGSPRVDLLPAEVRAASAARVLRKRLGFGLVAVAAGVVLAIAGASVATLAGHSRLLAEQQHTDSLMAEQRRYIEVRWVQQALVAVVDAERVGSWTEVQWRDYLKAVQASLPVGVVIGETSISAASPMEEFAQGAAPLDNPRIATVVFTAESRTLPDVPHWLNGLATLPGFAGANPDSVTFNEEKGMYSVTITLQVNSTALSGRFMPQIEESATPEDGEAEGEPTETEGAETDGEAQGGN